MADIVKGTTPSVILRVPAAVDLSAASKIFATFQQGSIKIRKDYPGADITLDNEHQISVYLDQNETLGFSEHECVCIQLNWLYSDGKRNATKHKYIHISKNLEDGVLS